MKTPVIWSALLCAGTLSAHAGGAPSSLPADAPQPQSEKAKLSKAGFDEFRNAIKDDFNSFRSAIIENYAKFLEGEWVPFEPKMILREDEPPKPVDAPRKDPNEKKPVRAAKPMPLKPTPGPSLTVTPKVDPSLRANPNPDFQPVVNKDLPVLADNPSLRVKPSVDPTVRANPNPDYRPRVKDDMPLPENNPSLSVNPTVDPTVKANPNPDFQVRIPEAVGPQDEFAFFGMPMGIEEFDYTINPALSTTGDMARQWRALDADINVRKAAALLRNKAQEMGLNGYLTYELASAYARDKFPDMGAATRMSLVHYLMANMGYDVRLALTTNGIPLVLIPFDTMVYGRIFLTIDGQNYTAMFPDGMSPDTPIGGVYTANLPKGADLGAVSSLRLDGLNLPEKPYSFEVSAGPLTLKGTLNENLFPMLYRYPQMPTAGYAESQLMPGLRRDLARQVKEQMGKMGDKEAVNGLLTFFHNGFDYATDQEQHGFEKPYFLEETLYYPQCDCEDRAIMMTTLMWDGLGLENVLIAYPGHESAAVHLDGEVKGTAYTIGGKTYYSSDPTFIGSSVGDCMPSFRHEEPTVDRVLPD